MQAVSLRPYYRDDRVTLYLGDMREILPALDIAPDVVVADPPYGETSLVWDRWPEGWVATVADVAQSMWCFGSVRMWLRRGPELARYWNLSQDVVWEKRTGSGMAVDRFRRVHEHVTHWYRGGWNLIHHETPRVPATPEQIARNGSAARASKPRHQGAYKAGTWQDDGTRLMRSVIQVPSLRGCAIHPTEKPVGLLRPLIEYACPPGGLVLDPFAGSGSTAEAARLLGRRSVLIEADERYCEAIAQRMCQEVLPFDVGQRASIDPAGVDQATNEGD